MCFGITIRYKFHEIKFNSCFVVENTCDGDLVQPSIESHGEYKKMLHVRNETLVKLFYILCVLFLSLCLST